MFVSKDRGPHYLVSREKPDRMISHWRPKDQYYLVLNEKLGQELFPDVTWKDEPKEIDEFVLK